jgi:hypothetical protein
MLDDARPLRLEVEPWRLRLAVGIMVLILMWNMSKHLDSIRRDLHQLSEAVVVASDEYPTPPSLAHRIERQDDTSEA